VGAPTGLIVLLRLFLVPVLGFLGFFVALAIGIPSDRIGLLGLAIATGTLILTVTAVDRARPRERRGLLLSIFSFSYACFVVLPVFVFYLGDAGYLPEASPNPIPLTPPVVTRGLLAALVGYAVLLAGYALPLGGMTAKIVPRMRREWSAETALVVALLTIPLGWVVLLGTQIGLIPARAGSGVLGAISSGTTFGIGLIVLCYQRYRWRPALVALALVIPPTMLFNFFTSSKGLFLRPLVMIVIVHVIVTRQLRAWWIVGFIALMALMYPVSMAYRNYMIENRLRAVQVIASPQRAFDLMANMVATSDPADYLKTGINTTARRLDALGILSVILRDSGTRVPFQGGWSLAYIPMSYVPRLVWPGKPSFETGQWVTDHFGYPGIVSSTGCTWIGELYFNFGWTGLLVGMTLLGVWFRFLQESFLGIDATIPAMLAGTVAILTIAPGLGGDLLGPTNGVIFNVTPIVLTHLLVCRFTRPPARLPPPL
jgi:hypothetical protein